MRHAVRSRSFPLFLCKHPLTIYVVYRPNLKTKSDADILRDAKLEAMGMPVQDDQPRRTNEGGAQMATDELVSSSQFSTSVY